MQWLPPTTSGSSAIEDYVVQYATSANGTYTTVDDGVSTDLSATVTGLTNGTPYWFKVAAVNGVGTGPASSVMAEGIVPATFPMLRPSAGDRADGGEVRRGDSDAR